MPNFKKILLIGANFSAVPLFFALKQRGFWVAVCGNVPHEPCHAYADASFVLNYADKAAVLAVMRDHAFDAIVPTTTDCAYLTAAWVTAQLNATHATQWTGFDDEVCATMLHTKSLFRDYLHRHLTNTCPAPAAITIPTDCVDLATLPFDYPVIVKPVDSFSGRGVTPVHHPDDLPRAIEHAKHWSTGDTLVIEQFVTGRLFSHSAFVRNQQIAVDFFVDEYCTVYPYQVNCSHHPSSLSATLQDQVRGAMQSLITDLQLCDGLLHTQFISDGTQFWIIECARRSPGDLYGTLITQSTGVDYADWFIDPFVQHLCQDQTPPTTQTAPTNISHRPVLRHTISHHETCVPLSFSHHLPADQVHDVQIVPIRVSGERIHAAPLGRMAILFATATDQATLEAITPQLADYIRINTYTSTPIL
jgi:biotin carboxylase